MYPTRGADIPSRSDDTSLSGLRIYTDGYICSKTGAAYVVFEEGVIEGDPLSQGKAFLGEATVFQAEVFALERAAHYAANLPHNEVTILSDCQSAIYAVSGHLAQSRTVFNAIKALNKLGSTKHVNIRWIEGHAGHYGNELADLLAKEASSQIQEGPEPFLPLPTCVVKSMARERTMARWTARWEASTTCRQTKIFFPQPNRKISKDLLKLNRTDLGLCVRHLTGHSFLQYHRSKVDQAIDPRCRSCPAMKEESAHIILDCPAFQEQRFQIFWEYQPTSIPTVWQLLTYLTDPVYPVWNKTHHLQMMKTQNDAYRHQYLLL